MDRKYFFELGAYDSGLQIWGGENFELSFKVHMPHHYKFKYKIYGACYYTNTKSYVLPIILHVA